MLSKNKLLELKSIDLDFCDDCVYKKQRRVSFSKDQNEVMECMNRTILERARSVQIHTGLLKQFWANAINIAVHLINRGPSMSLNCEISEEIRTDKEVNMNHLRIFSCISYVPVDLNHRSKLDPKSKRCIFIGYGTSEYDYHFWDPKNRKILRHKDVVFN